MAATADARDALFNGAVVRVTQAESSGRHEAVVHQHSLQLYGLLQQATKGDNTTERPRCPINTSGKAKWDAWTARKGMTQEDAKQEYIQLVNTILPMTEAGNRRGMELKRWVPPRTQTRQTLVLHVLVCIGISLVVIHLAIYLAQFINAHCDEESSVLCDFWLNSYWIRLGISWISVGMAFGFFIKANVFQLMSVLYISVKQPRRPAPVQEINTCPHLAMVKKYNLSMGKVGTATEEHPVMTFVPDPSATSFPPSTTPIEFPFDKTADMHFRRFKEPYPDPVEPALVGIETTIEFVFEKWNCVYKQRKLKLKNTAPGFIKRFASAEFIYFVEESLWDHANNILYVRGYNESFAELSLVKNFAIYSIDPENPQWSTMMQTGSVKMSNAFGFLRSTVEGFVKESYTKASNKALAYLKVRLAEEFETPQES
ncbi:hypothetical protein THRCLA_01359 [Thraustotheca clavata]|uniref:ACB domain-containing protein n=1 Tax=Thraustotheca clavata TaxID=74557 RepID=A0A1W0A9B9_9STRA|nr:hypothetical protein THRCLA_01359 [Thraustotheca clavata]